MILSTGARNAACDAIVDALDSGTTNASARLVFKTAGSATVATLVMTNPAFGSAVTGVATANTISDDTNAATGVIASADFLDRNNAVLFTMSVGATGSGAEIELSALSINSGDTVSVTSLTVTTPSS